MEEQKVYRAIGLMSGTSLDGSIDVALIETDGEGYVKPLDFYSHPYDKDVRDKVRACFGKRIADDASREAEELVTEAHIEAVKASGFEAGIIGFHGQTITHIPEEGLTWQLGDGEKLAQACGMDVISDMRSEDVKAGGQGAPLAPLYHDAMIGEHDGPVAVLNIGGVSNVTFVGEEMIAFDVGPGNALMDDYMREHFGQDYDDHGKIAASGEVHRGRVEQFLGHDFFNVLIPKSLDRNAFHDEAANLPDDPKDAMATLCAMTAGSVMASVKHFPRLPHVWYITGGGRKNDFLMKSLSEMLAPSKVLPIEEAGFDGDAVEAQAFAYLAVRSLLGLPLTMPGTTGVAAPQTGGVYHHHDQSS